MLISLLIETIWDLEENYQKIREPRSKNLQALLLLGNLSSVCIPLFSIGILMAWAVLTTICTNRKLL